MTQDIIPQRIIREAKAIQEAERTGQQLIIIRARNWGKTVAAALAKGEQILPTDPPIICPAQN